MAIRTLVIYLQHKSKKKKYLIFLANKVANRAKLTFRRRMDGITEMNVKAFVYEKY